MRPLIAVIIYLTAMCAAGVSAGYFSLVLEERRTDGPEEVASGTGAEEAAAPGQVNKAYFARQASVFTWGMRIGVLLFGVAHLIGFCWLKGGLSQLSAEADPEDLLRGLGVYLGAAALAAALGGVSGVFLGGS